VSYGSLSVTKQITAHPAVVVEQLSSTKVRKGTPVTISAKVAGNGRPITDGTFFFTLNNSSPVHCSPPLVPNVAEALAMQRPDVPAPSSWPWSALTSTGQGWCPRAASVAGGIPDESHASTRLAS
jgi:hypothetical protein